MSARHYREAINATCFVALELSGVAEQVRMFSALFADSRWASLATCVQQLLPLQGALMQHLYLSALLHSSQAALRIAGEGSFKSKEFDASVKNSFVWCYAAIWWS